MARTFRRQRSMHALSELNVTNLLDLAFVLLIIFMIATPLMNQEQKIEVNLPVESPRPQKTPDKDTKFVAVTVKADGSYRIDADGNRVLAARDLPARLQALAATAGAKDRPVIRIRGDAGVDFQNIVTLMDELKKTGFDQVTFDTQVKS